MKHRRVLKIGSFLLVLALVFSFACAPTGEVEQPEKVIVIGSGDVPRGFNPFTEDSNVFFMTMPWIWDSLYQLGLDNEAIPDLAKEVAISPDGKTYTITIRNNAQWQDGVPLTAEDVAFTYNYIIDNEMGWYASLCTQIIEIKAIDDYTVEMTLDKAWNQDVLNYSTFSIIPIIPQHIWQDITGEEALGLVDFPLEKAIGSGPYQVVDCARDEYVRLRATPQAKEEGVKIDEWIIKAYADDSVMLQDFKAGNIDGIYRLGMKLVPAVEEMPGITLIPVAPNIMYFAIFNSWDKAYEAGRETHPHPALKDVKVREALDWALDEKVAAELDHGKYAIPGCQYLSTYYGDFSHTELPGRGYDLDKARQILDEAGYLDTDGDGIRETADGLPLEFDSWVAASETGTLDVATVWAMEAEKIGIKMTVSVVDDDTLWEDMNPKAEYDISWWGWSGDPDPYYLLCTPTCAQAVEGGWNESGYCNPEFDRLYEEEALAKTHEERRQILWEMQEILYRDIPYIVYDYHGSVCTTRNDKLDPEFVKSMGSAGMSILDKEFVINADTVS
ncbi:MAG: peptide ABC transporter substrate-binding protein [Dehalococcoidia bacterium]|nr:peptide ABC transporter substrate-binding protein [Dehalococcoidia bacterium]